MTSVITAERKTGGRGFGAITIHHQLRVEILSLQLKPGQLIDEAKIAERFEVSRSPVREALVRLEAEGLVDTLPNKGTVVAGLNIEEFPQYIDALDLVQRAVTRLAAECCSATALDNIKAKQALYRTAVQQSDVLEMIQKNIDFHLAIAAAGRNVFLYDAYKRLLDNGRRMIRMYWLSYEDRLPADSPDSHDSLIEAIANHDGILAESLAREHAEEVHHQFISFMSQRNTRDFSSR